MKKGLITGIWLIIVAGGVLGWARINNINSFSSAYSYFHGWSDHVNKCVQNVDAPYKNCVSVTKGSGSQNATNSPGSSNSDKGSGIGGGGPISAPELTTLQQNLKTVPVGAADSSPYNRAAWPHWVGSPCDARVQVLEKYGTQVKTQASDSCYIISGSWKSPYDDVTVTDPSSLDIDHVVPLEYADVHGGAKWSIAQKTAFANDVTQLLPVTAHANRSKGDDGPSTYMPEKSFQCSYAKIWITTTLKYHLTLAPADKAKLSEVLTTC